MILCPLAVLNVNKLRDSIVTLRVVKPIIAPIIVEIRLLSQDNSVTLVQAMEDLILDAIRIVLLQQVTM